MQKPKHIFLLESPIKSCLLAQKLQRNLAFRTLTQDCGQLLSSPERMNAIPIPDVVITTIVGVKGLSGTLSPFGTEANDGIVAFSEVNSELIRDQITLPIVHSLLPASQQIAQIIIQRVKQYEPKT